MDKNDLQKMGGHTPGQEVWVNNFTEESAQEFREALLEEAKDDSNRPIVVFIDSYGGQADSLSKMIETMDEVPNPIVTVACGKVMSCGAILLSHGDVRFAGHHARMMVHEASGGTSGDVHDMGVDAEEIKRLNRYFMNLLAKNCNLKGGYDTLRKIIKSHDGRDMYLDAAGALKFGLVDAIGMPRVSSIRLYQIETVRPKHLVAEKPNKNSETKQTQRKRKKSK